MGVGREEEQQEKGEKESKMRNEGDDSAASDTILEAVVDVSLSRIFEMGTECEHGAGAMRVFFVSAAGIRRVSYPRFFGDAASGIDRRRSSKRILFRATMPGDRPRETGDRS